MVNRVASFKMLAIKWSLEPSSDMGPARQTYLPALAQNIENGRRRYKRQWSKFRAQVEGHLLDDTGMPLKCPDLYQTLPPVPAGLLNSRPCLCLTAPNVTSPPKRERDLSPDDSNVMSDIPDAKRCLSGTNYEGQDGNAPLTQLPSTKIPFGATLRRRFCMAWRRTPHY